MTTISARSRRIAWSTAPATASGVDVPARHPLAHLVARALALAGAADRAEDDGGCADTAPAVVVPEHAGEADEAVLGRRVSLGVREADAPGYRRDVHDVAVAAREHARQQPVCQLDRRDQVQAHDRLRLRPRHDVELALRIAARVVDEDVDRTEVRLDRGDDPLDFGFCAEIRRDGDRFRPGLAQLGLEDAELDGRPGREREGVTSAGQPARDVGPDASRSSSDEGNLHPTHLQRTRRSTRRLHYDTWRNQWFISSMIVSRYDLASGNG
jgi:hypothetical protein